MLVRKYSQVIQRYYVQYLAGFDAIALNQMMQNLSSVCPEDESIILSSLCKTIASLSVKQGEELDVNPSVVWEQFSFSEAAHNSW